jgi:hypothetical protein
MLESTTTLLATAITDPWMKSKSMRETWIRASGSAYWVYAPISPASGMGLLGLLGNPNNTSL